MGLGAFFRGLDRLAGRINRWLGATPLVTGVQGPGTPPRIDETSVKAILGEIERASGEADQGDSDTE
jgi:hypothetical protein